MGHAAGRNRVRFPRQLPRGARGKGVATTRTALDREFLERRVKTNLAGLPISVGNVAAVARGGDAELTYGEIAPQLFESRVPTIPVAWTVRFVRSHYAGGGGTSARLNRPSPAKAPKAVANAQAWANGAASARAGGGRSPGPDIRIVGIDATLRVYVEQADRARYMRASRPFGKRDLIGYEPSWYERLWLGLTR